MAIQLEHLNKSFGSHSVFRDFSLLVKPLEAVAVVGESGCGKTTLLRMIAGLDREYTGNLCLNGKSAYGLDAHLRDVALVFQEPVLWNHMTVRENILFPIAPAQRKAAEPKLQHLCERMEIAGLLSRYPHEISGGQAKRVSLARALLCEKSILLLDEPLSNLDADTKSKVVGLLADEYIHRCTVIYVSHDMQEVQSLCDRVISL